MHEPKMLSFTESATVELKETWTETVKKTLSAFANTQGGTIYFGINDEGKVLGLSPKECDKIIQAITHVAREGMRPTASDIVRCNIQTVGTKSIVAVHILEGSQSPYSVTIKEEGARIYVRQGSCSFEASPEEERALIRKSDPRTWEERPCANQKLTFKASQKFFDAINVSFTPKKYAILGVVDAVGFFTNLGFLLSDQCTFESRVGFFMGDNKGSASQGLLSFTGSILQQLKDVMATVYSKFGFTFAIQSFDLRADGTRAERAEYPQKAIREALVNAFVHQDFSVQAPTTVSIFSNRVEFLSVGGLPPGIAPESLKEGVSVCRNKHLAEIFMRLGLMERYGMGIPTIYASYQEEGLEPQIKVEGRVFKITLPKIENLPADISPNGVKICRYLRQHETSSRAQMQKDLSLSYSILQKELNLLIAHQLIERIGSGPSTRYRIAGKAA